MIESGYYIDMTDFDKKFNNLMKNAIPEYGEEGAFKAMEALLLDAVEKPPQAPKDIGELWGSRIIEKAKREGKESSIVGGFNKKYARRHHEVPPGTFKYTLTKGADRPGPKFLESKMVQFKEKYAWIIAETIRRMSK